MSFSVQMPALGESVTEGTVTRWLKQEGDHVEVDEPLLEVSTDKVDTEIPSPASGVLQRIVVPEDETVDVGAELAVIGDGDGDGGDSGGSAEAGSDQGQDEQGQDESAAEQEAVEAESEPAQEDRPAKHSAEESGNGSAPEKSSGSGGSGGSGGKGSPVLMPALGESVTEGTVTRWLKQVGDEVAVDEPLLEVSTDKVDTEIPAPVAGTLLEITAGEDETVEVGGQLALIGSASEAPDSGPADEPEPEKAQDEPAEKDTAAEEQAPKKAEEKAPDKSEDKARDEKTGDSSPWREPEPAASAPPAAKDEPAESQPARQDAPAAESNGSGGAPYVTPLVRRLAVEHDVDLGSVRGTGVGGRIRKQDVLAAAERSQQAAPAAQPQAAATSAPAAAPAAATKVTGEPSADEAATLRGTTQKMSRLRKVIAQRMVESLQMSAQLTCVVEVDVTRVAILRQRAKAAFEAREGVKLSFLPFFVKATVETLKLYPNINASIDGEKAEVTYHDSEHIGIAVDTERGLLVPVLHNAGDLSLAGISRQIADLAERTRTNKINPDELSGGTFTITNIGSRGALTDTPIINQPQVAILGTGAVVKRPVVVTDSLGQDSIAIRSIAALVLTYDHRLVDGADAARFLSSVKARMEAAQFESDLGL
ncbi:MAG TPA: 2-oxoglutarate dehydrogenase, E2 component, dihydrolipoamide succinyltransferase [Pseudonocardia sp.]|nr:2-oxoglutarate dehydrogenase, E2 component, dihydrolipoamide succinyltransferase [Pseudonocardia sp.]